MPDRAGRSAQFPWPGDRSAWPGHGEPADPLGEGLLGEGLLVVDGQVADLEDLVLVAGAPQDQVDELMMMKVTTADQMMTQMAARNCSHSWCHEPVYNRLLTANGVQLSARRDIGAGVVATTWPDAFRWPQPYSIMFGSAKMPTSRPPRKPAMPWV